MSRKKQNIVVCQGHLYLFWTTGVYYTAQLAECFNVILLVPETYRKDERFQQACSMLDLNAVVYYPFCGYSYSRHKKVAKQFEQLMLKYRPVGVVQHDYLGIENMYLFHFAQRSDDHCKRIVVLSSMPSTEYTRPLLDEFFLLTVERYQKKLHLPGWVWQPLLKLGKYINSFRTNKLLTALTLKTKPYFPLSRYANIDIIPNRELFDYYVVYASCEQQYLQELFTSHHFTAEQPFPLAAFPIRTQMPLVEKLCPEPEQAIVTLLPSLLGIRSIDKEANNLDKWINATKIIRTKLPTHRFLIKFHPGEDRESTPDIVEAFTQNCAFLEVVGNDAMAEQLIRKSRFVMGDVTTSLWWTYFHGDKLAISLQMEDYAAAKSMSDYPGIFLVEELAQLEQTDLEQLREQRANGDHPGEYPTIAEIVSQSCKK